MARLVFGGYAVEILPELGASIREFSFAGHPVLRPVTPDVKHSLDTGNFPLVPFANRIKNGVFSFGGRQIRQPMVFEGHPHALHGHGWVENWSAVKQTETELLLTFDHAPDMWPWPYKAQQNFVLNADGLTVELSLTNTGSEAFPVSLGQHPWFVRTPETVVTADVEGVWLADDTMLPTEKVAGTHFFDLGAGAALKNAPFVDNCHTGWKGTVVLDQPELSRRITLKASDNCPFLHIYTPVDADFVCAEPVTAMPDSFNRPGIADNGAHVVAPGETFGMSMQIKVETR